MMMMMMMIALGFCFLWSPWEPHIPMNLRYFGSSWNSSCQRPMVRHSRLWKRWSLRFVKWDSLPVFKETICWLFLPNIYTYIWPQLYDVNLWCLRTIHGRVFVIYDICMALFCVLSDNFSPTSIWNRKSQVEPWKTTRKIPCNMKSWLVKNKSLHFLGEISEEKNKGGIMPYIYIYTSCSTNQTVVHWLKVLSDQASWWEVLNGSWTRPRACIEIYPVPKGTSTNQRKLMKSRNCQRNFDTIAAIAWYLFESYSIQRK